MYKGGRNDAEAGQEYKVSIILTAIFRQKKGFDEDE